MITDTGASSGCLVEGMPRGIRNDYLPDVLGVLGLAAPATADWSPASVVDCQLWGDALKGGNPTRGAPHG